MSGDLQAALETYLAVKAGLEEAEELSLVGLISLELAILYARQDAVSEVTRAAAESATILASLNLHPETLASVSLLSQSIEAEVLSVSLLRGVREQLRQDPMMYLSQEGGGQKRLLAPEAASPS